MRTIKILIINGSLPHYDHGLNRVISVIARTLSELGMEIEEINLAYTQIPYFDGTKNTAVDEIVARMRGCNGIVLACTTQSSSPCAMMHTFLEHLEYYEYANTLHKKHCLLATASKHGGEHSVLEYLTKVVHGMGGFDCVKFGLQETHFLDINDMQEDAVEGSVRHIVEVASEDFYRAVRQNRQYIIPLDAPHQPLVHHAVAQPVIPQAPSFGQATNIKNGNGDLALEAFTERQEQDIKELTALFSQKYVPSDDYGHRQVGQGQPQYQKYQPPKIQGQPTGMAQSGQYQSQTTQGAFQQPTGMAQSGQYQSQMAQGAFQQPTGMVQSGQYQSQMAQGAFQQPTGIAQSGQYRSQTAQGAFQQPTGMAQLGQYQSQTTQGAFQQPAKMQHQPQFNSPIAPQSAVAPPPPRVKSVKQITQSLPHYYQSQMAAGLTAIIQFVITGEDAFEGYLTIVDSECEYTDGQAQNPEITIVADSAAWSDVLKGKHTVQKAFMIGGLKVRGNFVLLTKFDTLFKF